MNNISQHSDCAVLLEPRFGSIGDIRRASQSFREDRENLEAIEVLNSYRNFRLCCVQTSLRLLNRLELPEHVIISARLKRMKSIYRKLVKSEMIKKGSSADASNIDDVIGFRVIFRSLHELQSTVQKIQETNHGDVKVRIKNYLDEEHPIGHGYRGVHVIIHFEQPFSEERSFKVRFEVQLRTYYQHQWACWCESMGDQAKEGFLGRRDEPEAKKVLKELRKISDKVKRWEDCNKTTLQPNKKGFPFPSFSWLGNKFVVCRENGDENFDTYPSIEEAFTWLIYYEKKGVEALLILGTAESEGEMKSYFRETYFYTLFGFFPEPEHWLP